MPSKLKPFAPPAETLRALFARHIISLATEHVATLLGFEHGSTAYAILTAGCLEVLSDASQEMENEANNLAERAD